MSGVRQHVNPLSRFFLQPLALPAMADLFAEPQRPLHLDIGCARGRFLMDMARLHPQRNHLGLEIRRPLVERAEAERQVLELQNLRYLFCNANVSLAPFVRQLGGNQLQLVTIQFPDPWFKTKHHKRRLLQPGLAAVLADAMAPGGELFLQSDVEPLMQQMVAVLAAQPALQQVASNGVTCNPLPVPTERERGVVARGLPVHRALFRRTSRMERSAVGWR